ncbi:unnamed protein product [Ixodes persulcatus]
MEGDLVDGALVPGQLVEQAAARRVPHVHAPVRRTRHHLGSVRRPAAPQQTRPAHLLKVVLVTLEDLDTPLLGCKGPHVPDSHWDGTKEKRVVHRVGEQVGAVRTQGHPRHGVQVPGHAVQHGILAQAHLDEVVDAPREHLLGRVVEGHRRDLVALLEAVRRRPLARVPELQKRPPPESTGAVVASAAEQLGPPAGWVAAVDVEGVAPQPLDAHPHPGVPHAQRLVRRGLQLLSIECDNTRALGSLHSPAVCGEVHVQHGTRVSAQHGKVLALAQGVPENYLAVEARGCQVRPVRVELAAVELPQVPREQHDGGLQAGRATHLLQGPPAFAWRTYGQLEPLSRVGVAEQLIARLFHVNQGGLLGFPLLLGREIGHFCFIRIGERTRGRRLPPHRLFGVPQNTHAALWIG